MKTLMACMALGSALLLGACGGDSLSPEDGQIADQGKGGDATDADTESGDASVETATSDAGTNSDASQTDSASDTSGVDAPSSYPNCAKSCAVSLQVECERTPKDCVARCESALVGQCGNAWRQLTDCAATKIIDDYECSVLLASTLKPGVCDSQIKAVTTCLTSLDR